MLVRPAVKNASLMGMLLALLLASVGCKLTSYKPKSLWPMDVATQPRQPTKVAAIWSDNVLYTAGQEPTRGFGGRIYFYDERGDATKVDGKLVVYVYDDDSPVAGNKPTKRFVFSAQQLAEHYSGSELGPSYSVWIPWDTVGGPTKQLSLVPFFLPTEGGLIAGEHTRHRLPGSDESEQSQLQQEFVSQPRGAASNTATRQVSYDESVADQNLARPPKAEGMRTTTINIPGATRQRLANSRSIPREERTYVTPRSGDVDGSRWNHYDRARFNALRAAEYRGERFNRQRAAPWEQPAPAGQNLNAQSDERPRESAAEWAERYRQQNPLPQPANQSPARQPAAARPDQPEARFGRPAHPAPAGQSGRLSLGHARWQPGHAEWQSDSPLRPTPYPALQDSAASTGVVSYGN